MQNKSPQLLEFLAIAHEIERRKRENRLRTYRPYPKQALMHASGLDCSDRLFMAANQVGKCTTISSHIETKDGAKRMHQIWGKPGIEVLTYPDRKPRRVTRWIRKPAEECYRITLSDGRWFECPEDHQILTDDGYAAVRRLSLFPLRSDVCHPQTNQARGRIARVLGVRRWSGKLRGFLARCFVDSRLCGGRLQSDEEGVQVFSPSPGDVRAHSRLWSSLDGLVRKGIDSLSGPRCRPSNLGVAFLTSVQSWLSITRVFSPGVLCMSGNTQSGLLYLRSGYLQRTIPEDGSRLNQVSSCPDPVTVDGNQIVSIDPIGRHTLYDMEVEERHNYLAAGLVHHNSVCGGAEWAIHLTGRYPDWWKGAVFEKPVRFWCGGVTGESTRDNPQRILVGQPEIRDQWGTGLIPKEALLEMTPSRGVPNLLDSLVVQWGGGGDVQPGESSLLFKSYEKGREKWQGDTIDGVWFDEEPPMPVFSEGRTRTNNGQRGNFTLITFTPLLGMSEVVRMFLSDADVKRLEDEAA